MAEWSRAHKSKRLVLQCINGVSSNPVEGRTNICQLKDLFLTLLGLIFRYLFSCILLLRKTMLVMLLSLHLR